MKEVINGGTVLINGKEHELAASKGGKGHYLLILQRIADQFDAMLSYHSKVMVLRIDIRISHYTPTNKVMSKFIQKLKKGLGIRFDQNRVGYIWCREQGIGVAQHYHLALILDGNKNQKPHYIIDLIEEMCAYRDFPKPFTPTNCYYLVRRDDERAYRTAYDRMTYLAKVETKGCRPKSTNDFGRSYLTLKEDTVEELPLVA